MIKKVAVAAAVVWVGCVWFVGFVLLDLNANFEEVEDAAEGVHGSDPA